jgi:sugar phosphate permease
MMIFVLLESLDYFKNYLDSEPGDIAVYKSIIMFPWALKVIFGLISDNIKIFGLKRKPYLVVFGFLQFIAASSLWFFEPDNAITVVFLLMLVSFAIVFQNVVIEAIVVSQSRLDPLLGS